MPIPNKTDLSTLNTVYRGAPFVDVEAKSLKTTNLDTVYRGAPFVAAAAALNVWVKISGVWKQASAMYVRVSGVWKTVTPNVYTRVSGVWKS